MERGGGMGRWLGGKEKEMIGGKNKRKRNKRKWYNLILFNLIKI